MTKDFKTIEIEFNLNLLSPKIFDKIIANGEEYLLIRIEREISGKNILLFADKKEWEEAHKLKTKNIE